MATEAMEYQHDATILAQLDRLNIEAGTIYPSIEKAASDIARKRQIASAGFCLEHLE